MKNSITFPRRPMLSLCMISVLVFSFLVKTSVAQQQKALRWIEKCKQIIASDTTNYWGLGFYTGTMVRQDSRTMSISEAHFAIIRKVQKVVDSTKEPFYTFIKDFSVRIFRNEDGTFCAVVLSVLPKEKIMFNNQYQNSVENLVFR